MIGPLTINQREYVLYHLGLFVEMSPALRNALVFSGHQPGKICFMSNEEAYSPSRVIWINDLPVLFPGEDTQQLYEFDAGTLSFKHDLLKSAFYLLSGFQEYRSTEKDTLGRFPYKASIQHELNIIDRPIVNEYFMVILEAISIFCKYHKIEFNRKNMFEKAALYLTHDVDRIDKYTFHTVKGALKKRQLAKTFAWFFKWINPLYTRNPKWTFEYLDRTERERGLRSCYYFLNKGVKHQDSYYSFEDKRIKELIWKLEDSGHAIGIHGGVLSSSKPEKMNKDIISLNKITRKAVKGNRQHRLIFDLPETMCHLETCGIKHDSSLGFAPREGFRNSFCHPFKLYDFEHDRMIDVWEIPLIVMDTTLFNYRRLDYAQAYEVTLKLKNTILRYRGVFTLLFHQDFLDEEEHPGIKRLYEKILDLLSKEDMSVFDPESLT